MCSMSFGVSALCRLSAFQANVEDMAALLFCLLRALEPTVRWRLLPWTHGTILHCNPCACGLVPFHIFIVLSFIIIIVIFSFFYHFPCPWHLKFRKTMKINENNGKQSKTKENEKNMKLQMKKKLDSKLQILTLNQEIFKNSRKCSFF